MKLCQDCDNFKPFGFCLAPENGTSPINGGPIAMFAAERRSAMFSDSVKCGPEAVNFRPKEIAPVKPWWWRFLFSPTSRPF